MNTGKFQVETFLSKEDYKELLNELIKSYHYENYLLSIERKFIETNPDMYTLLGYEMDERIGPSLNAYAETLFPDNEIPLEEKEKRKNTYEFYSEINDAIKTRKAAFTHENKSLNPEFTTSRQVLAIYHLLIHCKLDLSLVNKTDLARFSQFLTGKEANNSKIENTNIYKIWKGIYNKTEKGNAQDLRYIRDFFAKMGLSEICENIDKDING